jgi:hypothetical protein
LKKEAHRGGSIGKCRIRRGRPALSAGRRRGNAFFFCICGSKTQAATQDTPRNKKRVRRKHLTLLLLHYFFKGVIKLSLSSSFSHISFAPV